MRLAIIASCLLLAGCLRDLPEDAPDSGPDAGPDAGMLGPEESQFIGSPATELIGAVSQTHDNTLYLATPHHIYGHRFDSSAFTETALGNAPAGSPVAGLTASMSFGYAVVQSQGSWQLVQLQPIGASNVKATISIFTQPALAVAPSDQYIAAASGRLIAYNPNTNVDYGGAAPWANVEAVLADGAAARVIATDSITQAVSLYKVQAYTPAQISHAELHEQHGYTISATADGKIAGFTGAPATAFYLGDEHGGTSTAADVEERYQVCIGAQQESVGEAYLFIDHVVYRKPDGTFTRHGWAQFRGSAAFGSAMSGTLGGVQGVTFFTLP
jgi:hypothetical protein